MVTEAATELTVAVIGCGRMGANTSSGLRANLPAGWIPLNHAEAASSVAGLRVVAFCDTNRAAVEAAASQYGGEVYLDYRAMLADRVPDIVTVATRAEGRASIIVNLAEAGVRGVHAEKPLCRSLREGEAAAAAILRHGVAFSFGATRRYMAAYRQAKDLVTSGEFGAARQAHLHFGTSALQWTHPHSVDLAMFFAGDREPEAVQAALMDPIVVNRNFLDADPRLVMGMLRFPDRFTALITAASGCNVVIVCEDGAVSILADGETIECRKRSRNEASAYFREIRTEAAEPSESGLQVALRELRDALNGGRPPTGGIERALIGQRALFALALSGLRGGAETKLSDVPLEFTVTGRQGDLYA
jgi:scyllo-inositol 2-dehydrogenase (NAD+)